ncbi:MAG: hypothetical protein AAF727_10100 [Pseudomonadota bacterium]
MLDTLLQRNGRLSDAQAKQYWKEGFLFPLPALDAQSVLFARHELEA